MGPDGLPGSGARSIAEQPCLASAELSHPLITLLAGPTASGKSRRALETASRTGAVIINADSQQLYADLIQKAIVRGTPEMMAVALEMAMQKYPEWKEKP